jgi:hypothetical protein
LQHKSSWSRSNLFDGDTLRLESALSKVSLFSHASRQKKHVYSKMGNLSNQDTVRKSNGNDGHESGQYITSEQISVRD